MGVLNTIKDIVTIACIAGLLSTGVLITLKSGVVSVGGGSLRLIRGNVSRLFVTLAGCLAFFLMVQQVVRYPLGSGW